MRLTETMLSSVDLCLSRDAADGSLEFIDTLTPAQKTAFEYLGNTLPIGNIFMLRSDMGMGKTSVLRKLHTVTGGAFLSMTEFLHTLKTRHPNAIEEAFLELLEKSLENHETVYVDDLNLITDIAVDYRYPRPNVLSAVLKSVVSRLSSSDQKLFFSGACNVLSPVQARAYSWKIEDFTPEDYKIVCSTYLTKAAMDLLHFEKIHRFAPVLNCYQLKNACLWLRREQALNTDRFTEYLSSQNIKSNVELEEVQPVDWKDLKGLDDVIETLEAKIALPFENDALAAELQLKAKRGVLLAGPPGTGKTTIGRALAHRLKGKFFLLDGRAIYGTGDFYEKIEEVFKAAQQNAPSVIFIDDGDVIFESEDRGFYRYLLTMMDGLESASAERVCVMMTAMDTSRLPPAILRSGRVELWLETRLPDIAARISILTEKLAKLPEPISSADVPTLAAASRGLTGADLKAIIEDGKLLFAHDKATEKPIRPIDEYFLEAIATLRSNKRNYGKRKPVSALERIPFGFPSPDTDTQ